MVDLLAQVPVAEVVKRDVVRRMDGAERFYHGLDHLALLWRRHRRYGAAEGLLEEPIATLIASAILFHDCIYDVRRFDSEERSARHWLASSHDSGLAEADRLWVADTIRATKAHLAYQPSAAFRRSDAAGEVDAPQHESDATLRERARVWVLDLDLTPLGEEPAVFDENSRLLRRETPHLDDAASAQMRLRFLGLFAEAPTIYRTATLAAAFEAQARRNIALTCGA